MKDTLSSNREFPPCGYGLSGLCCSACLMGPCRISPFDRTGEKGKCGASADWLVAGNLLQMVAADTAARLADLAQSVDQSMAAALERPAASSTNPVIANEIFDKYGLDRAAVKKTGGADLLAAEVQNLLSLNHPARELAPFWSRLYPAEVFPQFYAGEILPTTSLALTGLNAFSPLQNREAALEDMLRTSLRASLVYLVCDELIQDLETLRGNGSFRKTRDTGPDAAETLPAAAPSEGFVLLSAPQQRCDERLEREIEPVRKQWGGALIQIPRPAGFLDFGRQFYRRYARPLVDTSPLALAPAPSAALVIGILTCGCSVFSRPGLPLYGSEPVSRFFSKDLKEVCGAVYLPPEAGEMVSVAHDYFRKKP